MAAWTPERMREREERKAAFAAAVAKIEAAGGCVDDGEQDEHGTVYTVILPHGGYYAAYPLDTVDEMLDGKLPPAFKPVPPSTDDSSLFDDDDPFNALIAPHLLAEMRRKARQ